ncbi:MAG: TldD/PmbA family protein [Candidatus Heimdallarchaeota archaeon]|nr:TldD/PmbA family protein [Candidatus Heimdallarchaeota archaeon]
MSFDTLKDDLLSLTDAGLKYAKSKGADQTEIFVSTQKSINVANQSGMIQAIDGRNEGIGVRIAQGKKMGFAAMSSLTDEALKHAVDEALTVAKSMKQDNEGFEKFANKMKPAKDGILDHNIVALTTEDIVNKTNKTFKESKEFDPRIISATARTTSTYGGYAIANSEGVSGSTSYTAYIMVNFVTAMEEQERKSAFDFSVTRSVPEDKNLGKNCSEKAIKLLGSKPLDFTGVLPTVWNPIVMSSFWQTSLSNSVNGRQVVEKNSYFMDKLGDKVGIPELTITDDGQLPEGLNTSEIDYEGVPRQSTNIIEKGVLRSFLYDSYYGRLGKAKSTGNATRGQDYESTPGISPTTIVIQPGSKSFDEIISGIDKGVYIMDSVMGMMHSNRISGDFSVVATSAYLIENGEITHPLNPITIAGNLYKSYLGIRNIGSDSKLLPAVKTPTIAFNGFTVNG